MLVLSFLACGTAETPPAPAPEAPAAEEPAHRGGAKAKGKKGGREGKADRGAGGTTDAGTLKELSAGDVACYVDLDKGGQVTTYHGAFELCPGDSADASALIGKPVVVTLQKEQVLGDSCEGDPSCTERKEVDFVVAIKAP